MEQEEIKKIYNQWLWTNQITRGWEIWACVSSKIKENEIYLCIEDYWKEIAQGGGNYWTVYPGTQNSIFSLSPQYYQDVWVLWWCRQYLHYPWTSNRWPTLQTTQEITIDAWTQGCCHYEASLPVSELATQQSDNPSGYQTWKYCITLGKVIIM